MKKTSLLCLALTLFALPVFAEDTIVGEKQKLSEKTYSPEYCAFTVTFPEEPFMIKRCESASPESCYNLISFTKVFDNMDATIKVQIICNPSTKEMYDKLDREAMRTTVQSMVRGEQVTPIDVNVREEEEYRQAGLLGKGVVGLKESIFISQLWSSPNSLMSVEAELIGQPLEQADTQFAAILKSIGFIKDFKATTVETQKKTDPNAKNLNE